MPSSVFRGIFNDYQPKLLETATSVLCQKLMLLCFDMPLLFINCLPDLLRPSFVA